MQEKSPGVYKITNIVNNKSYIGSTTNLRQRRHCHMSNLRNNKHRNRELQSDFSKYGESSFRFITLEILDKCSLASTEQHYLNTLRPIYNECLIAYSTRGLKINAISRQKMSISKRTLFADPVRREKLRQNAIRRGFGKGPGKYKGLTDRYTEEELVQRSESAKKAKPSRWLTGRKLSKASRLKQSESMRTAWARRKLALTQ